MRQTQNIFHSSRVEQKDYFSICHVITFQLTCQESNKEVIFETAK